MKKIFMILFALAMTITASAQFEEGKWYANTSLTSAGLSYSGATGLNIGIEAKGGYFLQDNWMLLGQVGFGTQTKDSNPNSVFTLGAGGRYYIIQNGIFLGANVNFRHHASSDDFVPGIEVGYSFFINGHVTIEPALYYDQSFHDHANNSTVGIKIGIGLYQKK